MALQHDFFNDSDARAALERESLDLTRKVMPACAQDRRQKRDWPVHLDHCFQRILLDNACGGAWRDHIAPPAYRNADKQTLRRAIKLGRAVIAGEADLWELNARSLAWRGKG